MKTYPSRSAQAFRLAGVVSLFLIWPLAMTCSGAPWTNSIPWNDNFSGYADGTPLISGTNGWYSSPGIYDSNMPPQTSIVQSVVAHSGQAAEIAIGDTLSNSFVSTNERIVSVEMYIQPQLWTSNIYPFLSTNASFASQFFVNSNGYFVVANGTTWYEATRKADGSPAIPITNSYFTRVQINLRYKNHTWNLKAWTNDTDLVASTYYVGFTRDLDAFSGFSVYNGTTNSYLDDVAVTNLDFHLLPKINGVFFDAIKRINGTRPPGVVNGVQ